MSTEFIIGAAISAIGAIATVIGVIQTNKEKKTGGDLKQLIEELDNTKFVDEQKKILRKIAKILSAKFHYKIKPDFIKGFVLDVKGKMAIVEKILSENNLKPTTGVCKAMLGFDSPILKEKIGAIGLSDAKINVKESDENVLQSAVPVPPEDIQKADLITSADTNTVFFSELLKERFPEPCNRLISVLDRHHISHKFIKETKDIWCRDYMPVSVRKDRLIQFCYDPSYLKGKKEWEDSRTDVEAMCEANGIQPTIFSDINLEGGNIVRYKKDRAIISDRVYSENPKKDKKKLIAEIEKLLEAEIIVLPSLRPKHDLTGHADGMVRFVDRDTILGNDRTQEFACWREGIDKVLKEHGITTYIDVPFFEYKDKKYPDNAIGIYVNYLEIKDLIVLPIFEIKGNKDAEAVELFKKHFPTRKIETINYNPVGLEGGLLNCTTWTLPE
jgi:agmatine/peptidylarginine deiminase